MELVWHCNQLTEEGAGYFAFHSFVICVLSVMVCLPLRKQAYSNILKILPPKNENFSDKKF